MACFACEPGQLCEGSACALCDATNCQGCCSALSGCISGSFQNGDLCGSGAGSCLVCEGPTVCIGGACTGAITPQAPGDPCASDTDCAALGAFAVCRLQTSTGVPYLGGFCTIECGADAGRCPLSSSCVSAAGVFGENETLCWPTCDLNCRSPGYTCYPLELQDGGTTAACWLDPDAPDGLEGSACADDSTCLTAIGPGLGVCIPAVSDGGPTGFVGGMCTAVCEISPTCGDGGICEGVAPPPTRPGEPFGFCAQACSTAWTGQGSCRSGYLCALGPTDVQPNGFCEPDCRNDPGLCQPGIPCSDAGYCCNGGFCLPMSL